MNKRSLTKNNKPKKVVNIYSGLDDFKSLYKKENIGNTLLGDAATLTGAIQGGIEAAEIDTSKADNAIEAVNNFQPITSSLDSLASSYNNTNLAKTNWVGSDFTKSTGEQLAGFGSDVLSAVGSSGGNWIKGVVDLGAKWISRGIGWGAGAAKANKEANRLNNEAELANVSAHNKVLSARDSILENETNEFMRNIVANGGKINIKPSKRGTFTAAAKQRGLGVQEFANKVLANKENYSTAMVRKANFAKNASKWHHAYGGPLYNHTGDWSNGLTFINEGGTHEENPFDGVLMGFDQEGVPNLVEEGEIIYNDYVFSNRLKPSKKQLESSGLNNKYNDWTFAKIVEDLQKGSAETPLDKISKESLDDMMATIINMQEEVRMKKGLKGENRMMSFGGNIFDGLSDFKDKINKTKTSILTDLNKIDLTEDSDNKLGFLQDLGMAMPTLDTAGKLISNAVKPVDTSNFIQAEAYSQIPFANIGRINVKPKREVIDQNAIVAPIINQGRATARDIHNLGTSGADVLNRLALNTYNTQKAVGEAALKASQMQFERDKATDALIAETQAKNAGLNQAEFAANLPIYTKKAEGLIQDAANREAAENAKLEAQDILSANMNQGIADLTRQNIEWNWIKDNPLYAEAVAALFGKKANGGMLTKRKRRK